MTFFDDKEFKALNLKGQLLFNEPLVDYNTWRVGGKAQSMYKPADINDLAVFLKHLPAETNLLWLGLGSNCLLPDQGLDSTIILTQGCLQGLDLISDGVVRVEAGVSCATMARFCARNGLSGAEFWAGIPGTMGGALRMNAGCFKRETWEFVEEVETMTHSGEIRKRRPSEFNIAYRQVEGLKQEWFIAATCRFPKGDKATALRIIKELLAHRAAHNQPVSITVVLYLETRLIIMPVS